MDNAIGSYQKITFPAFRNPTLDTLELGRKKHHIPVLLDMDVTVALQSIRDWKAHTGEKLSFTAWAMKCIAQAVSEHTHIQAMRKGTKSLILFNDVDISVIVERSVGDRKKPLETLPMPYIVRKANEKSVSEIHHEIRAAQALAFTPGEVQLGAHQNVRLIRAFASLPKFLRNLLVWRRLTRDPFFAKRTMGTLVVTSVVSSAHGNGYSWAIPMGIHPVAFALGNIAKNQVLSVRRSRFENTSA